MVPFRSNSHLALTKFYCPEQFVKECTGHCSTAGNSDLHMVVFCTDILFYGGQFSYYKWIIWIGCVLCQWEQYKTMFMSNITVQVDLACKLLNLQAGNFVMAVF